MVVTYNADEDDPSSTVSVGSLPSVQPRSPTTERARSVSVSDSNYAIIRQTIEVSLVFLMPCKCSRAHLQERRMLEQMEQMNSVLTVEAISTREQDARGRMSASQESNEASWTLRFYFRLLYNPFDAHWCRRMTIILMRCGPRR
jgi:hypothetical protein